MLDTNTCIFLMKNRSEVVSRYRQNNVSGISISSITASELYFGAYNSVMPKQNAENLANFLIGVTILDYDVVAADCYGKIRAVFKRQGIPISNMDMLIAAHAKSAGLILVTNNTREFERVDGLTLEDWLI
jgi:tRNA(fMet)-specific endonuclease VapC